MQPRTALSLLLSITLIFTIYTLYSHSDAYSALPAESPRSFESLSSLSFTLEQVTTAKVPTMRVHLRNSSPHAFTILTWGTPLDATALSQQIFTFTPLDLAAPKVSVPNVQISRVQPPPRADFLEIPPHKEVVKDIPLTEKWIPRTKLRIGATGRWHAVWEKALKDMPRGDLDKLTNSMRDEFHVREAEFDLSVQRPGTPAEAAKGPGGEGKIVDPEAKKVEDEEGKYGKGEGLLI
ncbi:hypothetical protein EJ05DRAFT_114667 [Pseudovirgaria hyperparasitica]|uniref:Uncharacterized protein n=1 Tax=Pseudovirgaria hyperparasitica TaxID=470096 RepID=A0A6A6VYQ6_9PEZI|nr:uncharacterized protein EJ05DRAFT_114667 [Pseudovirgaria hyperparasitica]KAF2755772.1 hypothetical protein EJ05DRAFT_114667 [Pseudovirgaria hyperparasitica]